ncbi:MAG: hypothetical protein V9G22_12450 [Ottowia sp.]
MKRGTKALWRGLAGLALLAAVLALADPARVLAALRHADAAWLLAGPGGGDRLQRWCRRCAGARWRAGWAPS